MVTDNTQYNWHSTTFNYSIDVTENGIFPLPTDASYEEALETYKAWASWVDHVCYKAKEAVGVERHLLKPEEKKLRCSWWHQPVSQTISEMMEQSFGLSL